MPSALPPLLCAWGVPLGWRVSVCMCVPLCAAARTPAVTPPPLVLTPTAPLCSSPPPPSHTPHPAHSPAGCAGPPDKGARLQQGQGRGGRTRRQRDRGGDERRRHTRACHAAPRSSSSRRQRDVSGRAGRGKRGACRTAQQPPQQGCFVVLCCVACKRACCALCAWPSEQHLDRGPKCVRTAAGNAALLALMLQRIAPQSRARDGVGFAGMPCVAAWVPRAHLCQRWQSQRCMQCGEQACMSVHVREWQVVPEHRGCRAGMSSTRHAHAHACMLCAATSSQ
jgi:hypothetical protein